MNKIEFQMDNGRTIIIEEGVKYDYLNPMNDIIFKSILRNDKNHIIVKTLAKEILNLDIKEVLEKDNGFSAKGTNMKGETCDYKVVIDGKTISIECNKKKGNVLLERNKSHLKRLIMDEGLDVVQINIDGYDIENKNKLVYEYEIKGKDEDTFYNGLVKIVHINISKLKNMEYNKDEIKNLNKLEKICSLFCIRKRDILEELVKGDEELMELKENIEDITSDIDYYDRYTKSEIYGMIEREEEKVETAERMIKDGIPMEMVMKYTELSKKQIEEIIDDEDYYDKYSKSEIYGMIEREEGIEEGREEEKITIAKNLLKSNISIDIISSSTGLSIETIQNLKSNPS